MLGEYRPVGVTLTTLYCPPPLHERVSHYLATAVTTAQRLMHAIVTASRLELPCFRQITDKRIHTNMNEYILMFRR